MSPRGANLAQQVAVADADVGSSLTPRLAVEPQHGLTFVLVHGAWHGGWCWRAVRERLMAAGHKVFTPTLTGLGERAHLRGINIGLETHIQDVIAPIECEELRAIVLAGHSYGGTVITAVAARMPERVRSLVYLDAILPDAGRAILEHTSEDQRKLAALHTVDGYLHPALEVSAFGIPESDRRTSEWMRRRLTPHPIQTFLDPLRLPQGRWPGHPKTYVRCTNPHFALGIDTDVESFRGDPDWFLIDLDAGHNAMMIAPDAVASIFLASA